MLKRLKSYLGLCKLKVVALIVFTAMVGMFLATMPPGMVPWDVLLFGNLGDFTTVTGVDCSIGNSGSATSTPPAGDLWFLVAGHVSGRYSSVGQSGLGERSLAGVESECPTLTAQDLGATCP